MKRMLCMILSMLLLIPVWGCQTQDSDGKYLFYYPRSDYGYNTLEGKFYNSIIETEFREEISGQSLSELVRVYLDGPHDQSLSNPFPQGLSLESVSTDGQFLSITVSNHLSELTGIRLMIACACLGRTGMELTNTDSVQICCKSALLDGQKFIALDKESVIFDDIITVVTDGEE